MVQKVTLSEDMREVYTALGKTTVPCLIAGGAVRDMLFGRHIKDYDVLVGHSDAIVLIRELEAQGYSAARQASSDTNDCPAVDPSDCGDFAERYAGYHCLRAPSGHILDILIVTSYGFGTLPDLINAVANFDNTMNMFWIDPHVAEENLAVHWLGYGYDTFIPLGLPTPNVALQLRQVSDERIEHVKEIAKEIGWVFYDPPRGLATLSEAANDRKF